ncbi:phosphoribosyl-ATP diphosphatase [Candidatus Pacearchaeota archaeon CG10_big_fil_rev_8_21_14_0_10_32_14]|nr:MAG: phosphoribosyl-ATP diphosphatase [Candidatus Pacearchaeota archaeon CG10_big_fil_rev_8_21_14_0_10_32_14]
MKNFEIDDLYKIIEERIRSEDISSYSYKLFKNPKLLNKKIIEEAREHTKTKNKNQVVWEASDLLYFVTVFLVKRNVKLKDVKKKLKERNKNKKNLK